VRDSVQQGARECLVAGRDAVSYVEVRYVAVQMVGGDVVVAHLERQVVCVSCEEEREMRERRSERRKELLLFV